MHCHPQEQYKAKDLLCFTVLCAGYAVLGGHIGLDDFFVSELCRDDLKDSFVYGLPS